jgi:two-component system sensor histidine kinase DesK
MRRAQQWWDGPWPWLAYLVFYGLPWLWREPALTEVLLSAAALTAFIAIYFVTAGASGRRLMMGVAAIAAIGVAAAPVGGGWTVFAFFAAMRAAGIRPRRIAVLAIVAVILTFAVTGLALSQPVFWWLPSLLTASLMGVAMLSREALYDRTRVLLATQEEVRRLAGAVELERMARDLHDVAGRTLTVVALKADLAGKLIDHDRDEAAKEIRAIAEVARSGLSDMRSALAGKAGGGLAMEIEASADALRSAGVAIKIVGGERTIPADAGALLAMTLREGVTNVIRHAGASSCTIELGVADGSASLVIHDDGSTGPIEEGMGLGGMRQRLAAAGGSLKVLTNQPGTRLIASVPT